MHLNCIVFICAYAFLAIINIVILFLLADCIQLKAATLEH